MKKESALSVLMGGVFAVLLFLGAQGCSVAPRHTLTDDEKVADMYWLFSQFDENYAPLELKKALHRFDYTALKAQYLAEAKAAKSNEDFYLVMHKFVAEFRDAHTSSTMIASSLPNRTKVAYLGFNGVRSGSVLVVKHLLPTISAASAFPIKVGDQITKLDGVELTEVVKTQLVPYRNLGQDESNLTYLMPQIFARTSIMSPLPTKDTATLTVKRAGKGGMKEVTVKVPWIQKDLYSFSKEQAVAAAKNPTKASVVAGLDEAAFFNLGFEFISGKRKAIPEFLKHLARGPGFKFFDSFVFVDTMPTWNSEVLGRIFAEADKTAAATPLEKLKTERMMPETYVVVDPRATFPTYISAEKVVDKDGKATGSIKQVAYMYLDTFSPVAEEATVLKEVAATLRTLKTFGVKDIVIDLINNGGGSLVLGMELAQLLSPRAISNPKLQFKLSETWLDQFEQASLVAPSDAEREIALRVYNGLLKDKAAGAALSTAWDVETISPFRLSPNADLDEDFNIYLLVNEMCASMCDIFTATLKENKMATVIGSKTMGAGGNVTPHFFAPNSHLVVNQTESLIVLNDGSYVENHGVEPNIAMNVSEAAATKYSAVRLKAVEQIVKLK